MKYSIYISIILFIHVLNAQEGINNPKFKNYWYSKGAEISKYNLSQSRYGENHEGNAMLIFVTEPMNPKLQVKSDKKRDNNVNVLKLNATRKFNTGVYPYSIMTSTFMPIDIKKYPNPLKISFSSQEWCGHVFAQMNLKNNKYLLDSKSYFESESDVITTLPKNYTEDGIMLLIRLNPSTLPKGKFKLIPSLLISRLLHKPLNAIDVTANIQKTKEKSLEGNSMLQYTIKFPELKRVLEISFEENFPHRIQKWKDTYPPHPYFGNKPLTTIATRTHTLYSPYWSKNKNKDRALSKKLGL